MFIYALFISLWIAVEKEFAMRTQKTDIDRRKLYKKWSDLKNEETKRHMAGFEEEVAYNRQMAAHRREVRKTGGGSPPTPPAPLPGDAVNTQPQTWPPTGHIYNPRSVWISSNVNSFSSEHM